MINMDTHGETWAVSNSCKNLWYTEDSGNSTLNSYHCTDYLVSDFINKIKNNENYKDTIIVVASDHYAMSHNNSRDIIDKKEDDRKILFFVIDPERESQKIYKKWITLDIGSTVLSMMWFRVENLWLWVNLLGDENY